MNDFIKPIDKMSDAELLALAESLEAKAREHQEHAGELEAYIAARKANKERAA